jgi:type I restriction enzyme R subunit
VDFVGIFERLEKALRFDSDDVDGLIQDVEVLRERFAALMADPAPRYLGLFGGGNDDKAYEARMDAFVEREAREAFIVFFRELRTLYEVLSPDLFLRPYVEGYTRLSVLYDEVHGFFAPRGDLEESEVARKTESLVRERAQSWGLVGTRPAVEIDEKTLDALAASRGSSRAKVFNLGRSLARAAAAKGAAEPYLIPLGERAAAIVEAYDDRQLETTQALEKLEQLVSEMKEAERERKEAGLDLPTFTVFRVLRGAQVPDARGLAPRLQGRIAEFPNHAHNPAELRGLKAALYKELLPVAGKERMVEIAEQILRLVKA